MHNSLHMNHHILYIYFNLIHPNHNINDLHKYMLYIMYIILDLLKYIHIHKLDIHQMIFNNFYNYLFYILDILC